MSTKQEPLGLPGLFANQEDTPNDKGQPTNNGSPAPNAALGLPSTFVEEVVTYVEVTDREKKQRQLLHTNSTIEEPLGLPRFSFDS